MNNIMRAIFMLAFTAFLTFAIGSWLSDNFAPLRWFHWFALSVIIHERVLAVYDRYAVIALIGTFFAVMSKKLGNENR